MSKRVERVAQEIKQEISNILHDDIKDPRIGFITITRVELTADLRFGRVFYSILGNEQQKKDGQEGLESAYKYIRKLLGERLKLRYTPDVSFKLDKSIDYDIRMGEIFNQLEKERMEKERKSADD